MDRKEKITKAGSIGEELVLNYLESSPFYLNISYSDNQYDMHKDIIAEKAGVPLKIECKLRTVIRKYNSMPLETSQWYKADTCDELYFINNPAARDEVINVYYAEDKKYDVVTGFGYDKGQETRMYPLSKMTKVMSYNEPEIINALYDLSTSSWKQ